MIPTPPDRRGSRRQRIAAYHGEIPAEELCQEDRHTVIRRLWKLGWSDREIAEHTRQTTYTVARLRARLGLRANQEGAA